MLTHTGKHGRTESKGAQPTGRGGLLQPLPRLPSIAQKLPRTPPQQQEEQQDGSALMDRQSQDRFASWDKPPSLERVLALMPTSRRETLPSQQLPHTRQSTPEQQQHVLPKSFSKGRWRSAIGSGRSAVGSMSGRTNDDSHSQLEGYLDQLEQMGGT
ncbi:hypothetical protein DUNSADRAFT_8107 [Dunaliella salina]|uniref:Encoded protein n=1 Tax=Dunaliella salina TaxID=3046 RepID=A0ABQ7GK11_DUNSA|nr:hypothetical protein DUNSADRAFT_8107 [Dunaliella salina]|eukprot:KAF5834958.1 hypothetical protein DUNSADRAFT_8107 [Dunaliella salina]